MATDQPKTEFEMAETGREVLRRVGEWELRDRSPAASDVPEHPTYWLAGLPSQDLPALLEVLAGFRSRMRMLTASTRIEMRVVDEAVELVKTEILGRLESRNPEAVI